MKFISSLLAIVFAIGYVAATSVDAVPPPKGTFTYWPQPGFQGVPVNISVPVGICTQAPDRIPLPIRSIKVPVGVCYLYTSTLICTGNAFPAQGSIPSIPPSFAGNINTYGCT